MSIPYFEIQYNDDGENARNIVLSDKEPKHFVRKRTYTPYDISDNSIKSAFDEKVRRQSSVYFRCMLVFGIIFALTLACSIYYAVVATNVVSGLIFYISTFGIGAAFVLFLTLFVIEFSFVKSSDDLFIMYDKDGEFVAVEMRKNCARVLYKKTLYVIKRGKIKATHSERKLYYAYLNMYPTSVLQMQKYFDDFDTYMKPVFISTVNYHETGTCDLSFGARGLTVEPNTPVNENYTLNNWLKHLHFCKYIFTVDSDCKPVSVYSSAQENAVVSYDVLTLATLQESGKSAQDTLKSRANETLRGLLEQICEF